MYASMFYAIMDIDYTQGFKYLFDICMFLSKLQYCNIIDMSHFAWERAYEMAITPASDSV